jgi:hypothetical protein
MEACHKLKGAKAYVRAWAGCQQADIDGFGNIWISKPQRGHWLDPYELAQFVQWCRDNGRGEGR